MVFRVLFFALVAFIPILVRADIVIDFDSLPPGTLITNQYETQGVVFSGDSPTIQFEPGQATSPDNILLSPFPPQLIAIDFSVNVFQVDTWAISVGFAGFDGKAFDDNGNVLDSIQFTGVGTAPGAQDFVSLSSSTLPIARIEYKQINPSVVDLFGIDDLSYSPAIPEPSIILPTIFVSCACFYASRRKKRRQRKISGS